MLNSFSGLKFSSVFSFLAQFSSARGLFCHLTVLQCLCLLFFFQGERHLWPPPTFTVSLLVCVCVFHPKGVRSLNNVRVFFCN